MALVQVLVLVLVPVLQWVLVREQGQGQGQALGLGPRPVLAPAQLRGQGHARNHRYSSIPSWPCLGARGSLPHSVLWKEQRWTPLMLALLPGPGRGPTELRHEGSEPPHQVRRASSRYPARKRKG